MDVVLKELAFNLLKKLSEAVAPSGFEDGVKVIVMQEMERSVDKMWIDSMGNIIAFKKGNGNGRVMITAHMDEIGLMINAITNDGFLKFVPIGGWNERILPNQRVLIKTLDGKIIRGVIGVKPPHIMRPEEAKQVIPMTELFIDVGASSKEEVEKIGIGIGSIAVLERTVERLGNPNVVTGKGFDNRAGTTVLVLLAKMLENVNTEVDTYFVATVQEEVGLKGARTAAFAISPDLGIAIDVTIAADVPGVPEHDQVTKLGKGPAIKIMDGRAGSGVIVNPAVLKLLIDVAKEEGIPYQIEVLSGGTTDASAIQLTREGVPVGVVSIPTRYIHSAVEVLHLDDLINTAKLVIGAIKRINKKWIEENIRKVIK
jgi:endoglucanase